MFIKQALKKFFLMCGYEIRALPHQNEWGSRYGRDPYADMRCLTEIEHPVVFDVGANVGQSISRFRRQFADPVIHAFEPNPEAFAELSRTTGDLPKLSLNNYGLGSTDEIRELVENTHSDMSSFLEPGPECWGEVKARRPTRISTLDQYGKLKAIERIDILKTDTQGFDLEVLKGAKQLLAGNRIHLVYLELNFFKLYENLPRFDAIYGFLADNGFSLVTFYQFFYKHDRLAWTDALFVNLAYEAPAHEGR
jgi:FkbM family methyltransferase